METNENKFSIENMSQKRIDVIKISVMVVLIVTMLALAFVIFKYGSAIKQDPCSMCDCTRFLLSGGYS